MLQNTPNQLESLSSEHRALALLRLLLRTPTYKSNTLLISDWLCATGLACSALKLKAQLRELEEAGLLETSEIEGTVVVRLLKKGVEVAEGGVVVEGVLRPTPECTY